MLGMRGSMAAIQILAAFRHIENSPQTVAHGSMTSLALAFRHHVIIVAVAVRVWNIDCFANRMSDNGVPRRHAKRMSDNSSQATT